MEAQQGEITGRFPGLQTVLVSDVPGLLTGMDSGLCGAAVIFEDAWVNYQAQPGKEHCDKMSVGTALYSIGNGIPVNPAYSAAFSWAISRALSSGRLVTNGQATNHQPPATPPDLTLLLTNPNPTTDLSTHRGCLPSLPPCLPSTWPSRSRTGWYAKEETAARSVFLPPNRCTKAAAEDAGGLSGGKRGGGGIGLEADTGFQQITIINFSGPLLLTVLCSTVGLVLSCFHANKHSLMAAKQHHAAKHAARAAYRTALAASRMKKAMSLIGGHDAHGASGKMGGAAATFHVGGRQRSATTGGGSTAMEAAAAAVAAAAAAAAATAAPPLSPGLLAKPPSKFGELEAALTKTVTKSTGESDV